MNGATVAGTGPLAKRPVANVLGIVLLATFVLYLLIITPNRFGSFYDDAIYVTAAKSLATGQGYRIISLPQDIAQTLIPPLYPFLLSLIWRANPHFPDNTSWMMLLSAVASVAFLATSWRYLTTQGYANRRQALAIIALAGINWRTMTVATGTISEVVFAFLAVATLLLAEKYENEQRGWIAGASVGVMAGLVFLTRTSGLVLLASIAVYYLARRRWRKLIVPLAVAAIFVAVWLIWSYGNRTGIGGEHAAYYAGYTRGASDTIAKLQELNDSSSLMVRLKILESNALGLILVWLPLEALGLRSGVPIALLAPFVLLIFVAFVSGFVREARKGIRLLPIYLVFYLGLHLVFPVHSYERYLWSVMPFLLWLLVSEVSALISAVRAGFDSKGDAAKRVSAFFLAVVLAGLAGFAVYNNVSGIVLSSRLLRQAGNAEDEKAIEWIKSNTDPSDVLVCFGDQKYYLYTDRKAVRSVPVLFLDATVYQARDPDPDELVRVFLNIVRENHGNYFVLSPGDFQQQAPAYGKSVEAFVEKNPEQFVLVFESGSTKIYRIENNRG
jgi:Dolichyl-phosphate-mannose-protein mannosyltransferase